MYESPINRIYGEINNEIIRKDEEHLMTIITQQVGCQVNREELIKALQYDRNQYEKGFSDALDKIQAEIKDTLYVDSLIFGELIDFLNGKISADDVIEEFNRITRLEILQIIEKYRSRR